MPIKRYKAEQIVTLLRQIEVGIANGKLTPQACKEAEITVQTFYRWRKEYGGLKHLRQASLPSSKVALGAPSCLRRVGGNHPNAEISQRQADLCGAPAFGVSQK